MSLCRVITCLVCVFVEKWLDMAKKNARNSHSALSLQRRNRGETIKKQLLHLNEYGLSGYGDRVSTSVFSKSEKTSNFVAN